MTKIEVKFDGKRQRSTRRRNPPGTRAAGGLRNILMRPVLVILGAVTGFVLFVGTPHIAWDYQCAHATRGVGTCREAAWCAYYGFQGRRVDVPERGEICAFVKFIRIDWTRLTKGLTNGE